MEPLYHIVRMRGIAPAPIRNGFTFLYFPSIIMTVANKIKFALSTIKTPGTYLYS